MVTPSPNEPYPLAVLPDAELTRPSGADPTEPPFTPMSATELAVRVNFMGNIRAGANLHQAAAMAGCSVRTIYGWLAAEPRFRQRYHDALWEAEKNSLEHVRQLAPESVRAAIYLAERQRERSQRRSPAGTDQPLEEILARIEVSLRTMFAGFWQAVGSIEDEELRKRLVRALDAQVEPVNALLGELWQRFETSTT